MVLIRVDGNNSIGMGHIARCLTIAKAIACLGVRVLFVVSNESDTEIIENDAVDFVRAESNADVVLNKEVERLVLNGDVSCLLIDSYKITESELDSFNCKVPVYYIDDLNMFDYNVTGIVNYNFEAGSGMYKNTKFPRRRLLLGPKFFPLNSELADSPDRFIRKNVENVLITTGSTDPNDVIVRILREIDPARYSSIEFRILIGKFFSPEYIKALHENYSKYDNVEFMEWAGNISGLYNNVDLMIAPGASMIFEALSLGVPCMSYMFADNQAEQCYAMSSMEIAPYIGDFRGRESVHFLNDFIKMLDYKNRKRIQKRACGLIDKHGARRIAEEIVGSPR